MVRTMISLMCSLGLFTSIAQSGIDDVLNEVKNNNKSIQTAQSYVESKRLEYQTGNNPDDPFIGADYMIGRPVAGGNQLDLLAIQQFDFPSAYKHRSNLADERTQLLQFGLREIEQLKLLEAKTVCLEIIYQRQLLDVLSTRKATAEQLVNTYSIRFEKEEITAIDMNKAKLQLLGIQAKIRETESAVIILEEKLSLLNGGTFLNFGMSDYPASDQLPPFEVLKDSIVKNEPQLNWLAYQAKVFETELNLTKSMTLPKFEVGYHHQSVLGQTFNGAHFGISIPLWQQKNTVKVSQANIEVGLDETEEYQTELHFNVRELYEQFNNLSATILDYEEVLSELNSADLLKKSLELGEIDFITYALELDYFYKAIDDLLYLKKEKQIIYAEIFKYQL